MRFFDALSIAGSGSVFGTVFGAVAGAYEVAVAAGLLGWALIGVAFAAMARVPISDREKV